jgi:ATP-dependent Clp protease ATP-binding subunit ClpC
MKPVKVYTIKTRCFKAFIQIFSYFFIGKTSHIRSFCFRKTTLRGNLNIESFSLSPTIQRYEAEIKMLSEQKETAIQQRQFDLAGEVRERLIKAEDAMREEKERLRHAREEKRASVGADDIADVVTAWTKIPVKKLADSASERLLRLEELLTERIVGQERAISAVARAIRRGRVGLGNPLRPICSLLFMGPTGVGKTVLASAVA